jgi:hypothetical protein
MLREAGPGRLCRLLATGFVDDHWVVEVWNADRGWHVVDAQVAGAQPVPTPTGQYGASHSVGSLSA